MGFVYPNCRYQYVHTYQVTALSRYLCELTRLGRDKGIIPAAELVRPHDNVTFSGETVLVLLIRNEKSVGCKSGPRPQSIWPVEGLMGDKMSCSLIYYTCTPPRMHVH
ncbi:hypothetical protein SCLCIDRAFT_1020314 [Scleroderma citrinum Foug A]|uniref:Uncharacterized protein n=1 Tax=Scleroderma citrinum Foug A TaxID=1036808 RepID=A0A0C3A3Y7_9AGAM|nr:hypothetical protein SCLCIDRAFT_1020314 [Scleroderma citrinum Foug A]